VRSTADEVSIVDAAINVSVWLSKQEPTKPEDSGLPLASQGTCPDKAHLVQLSGAISLTPQLYFRTGVSNFPKMVQF
jgi:hypothetical protein